jgi:hypothetical protein
MTSLLLTPTIFKHMHMHISQVAYTPELLDAAVQVYAVYAVSVARTNAHQATNNSDFVSEDPLIKNETTLLRIADDTGQLTVQLSECILARLCKVRCHLYIWLFRSARNLLPFISSKSA